MADEPHVVEGGANHRDLYVLIAGLVLGLLLGPWGLGQLAPEVYVWAFRGGGEQLERLAAFDKQRAAEAAERQADLDRLREIGVTDVAIEEKEAALKREEEASLFKRMELQVMVDGAQRAHGDLLDSRANAIIAALLLMMVLDTLVDGRLRGEGGGSRRWRGRLTTLRYGLMAVWLALALARFEPIVTLPGAFLLGLVVVGVAAVLAPLPGGARQGGQGDGAVG